ncbi:penicillin-binding transpeptidase domain-containing protein [bacterium 210820-DFI.6.37]|nr:penicillin-binding transpeptidase domain-containing protein [bacterium 210820-DFI.6.37]
MNGIKTHRILIAAIGIALAAAAVLLIYKFAVVKSPERVLTQYMSYIEQKDYEAMYDLLDEESKHTVGKEDFITRNQNIYEGIEAENIKITISKTKKKKDTVTYRTVMDSSAGEIRFPNVAEIHKESGRYRIAWKDSLIFPQLGESDKVKVLTLKADRGNIYDRNGTLLAGKGKIAAVGLIPGKMREDPKEDLERMAELLDMSVSDIQKKLDAKWVKDDLLVPIKKLKKVNEKSSSTVDLENAEIQKQLVDIPGVIIGDEDSRIYPLGEQAAHLIGYVQGISAEELESRKDKGYDQYSVIGKSGLEKLYEQRLHGTDGEKIVIYSGKGYEKAVLAQKDKQDGEDIHLTIDADLQSALYDAYKEDKSCTAAMNPKTGEVLALVSTPAYDSNDFVVGLSDKRWKQLNEDKNTPMYNRFRQTWCPGSSLKPIIGAAGITAGALDPDQDMGRSGLKWQKDSSWGGYYVTTLHEYSGTANLENALIYSDNIYFAKAALKMGADTLAEQLERLGFGEELPFAVAMSQSQYSSEGKAITSQIQLADSGYGQGQVLVNPLHLACLYSAFQNSGDMVEPHLETSEKTKWWIKDAFSDEAVKKVSSALKQVIRDPDGTGHGARLSGTVLAGKTGTAEIKASQTDTSGTELGWFCVYNPEAGKKDSLLLVTMVEDVKDRGGSSYVVKKDRPVLEKFMR